MSLWSKFSRHNKKSNRSSKGEQLIQVWSFNGGIHPPEMKSPANLIPLSRLPLVDHYLIPLQQHMGGEAELAVKIGDRVLKGQQLTFGFGRNLPVHAPTSGVIEAFVKQPGATYWGEEQLSILLRTDFQDESVEMAPFDYLNTKPEGILSYLQQAGIAGLGGAGFPTATKLDHATDGVSINTLIINAAECEPYISADDRLMREHAEELITGLDVLRKVLRAREIIIGIEDNKPEAFSALQAALDKTELVIVKLATRIVKVPTKYPSGGAKQLTKLLTGKEVPTGKHASDIGICMLNVGTLYAIKRAVFNGEPLIERVVTLTGTAFAEPANYWVRIGTPIHLLLQQVKFDSTKLNGRNVVMGGPLMGFEIDHAASIIKTTNCLLARTDDEIGLFKPAVKEQACIRCGECVAVCPANLLPQQLFWFSQSGEHEKAKHYHLFDCIECGACEYVCPSHIPLVHYYKVQKQEIRVQEAEQKLAALAKERYTAKLERMEAEKLAREARHKALTSNVNDNDKSAVAAAIARVKAKKAAEEGSSTESSSTKSSTQESDLAVQVVSQKPITDDSANQPSESNLAEAVDPRKAAVAAALARAKAKKSANTQASEHINQTQPHEAKEDSSAQSSNLAERILPINLSDKSKTETDSSGSKDNLDDPRKAAVAAALARAKAKREAKKQDVAETNPDASPIENISSNTSNLASVESPELSKNLSENSELIAEEAFAQVTEQDPRKAAVAAALARAKAKRAAKQTSSEL